MLALTRQEIVEAEVEDLALLVLQDLAESHAWSEVNYLNAVNQGQFRGDPTNAVAGAFGWLRGQGLIAREASDSRGSAFVITPAGHRKLAEGVALDVRLQDAARLRGGASPGRPYPRR
jgi:predicted amidohydrolase